MTEYSDLDEVNRLYAENENVNAAIDVIDNAGGWVSAFTVMPGTPPTPKEGEMPVTYMATSITVPPPGDPDLTPQIRAALVKRSETIMAELASLGVTDTPPTGTRRQPPVMMPGPPIITPPMPPPLSAPPPPPEGATGALEPVGATGTAESANGATEASSGATDHAPA